MHSSKLIASGRQKPLDQDGYFRSNFNGTSASTPVVSGVVALMLDANEGLGWRDVQNILATSATLTGSNIGGSARGFEQGAWYINDAANWNGGGMHLHTNYGYGMVNAYNAVRMAEVWHLFGAAATSGNERVVSSNIVDLGGLLLPDGNATGRSFNLTVADNVAIEHVSLAMSITSTWIGDLRVVMTSPEGTQVVVALQQIGVSTNFSGTWIYGIDALRGELAAGTWTVQVADRFEADENRLFGAQLQITGAAVNADTVHHITDEFRTMRALESARGTIRDSDGGSADWLNFAAVAGNVTLNLTPGSNFSVSGTVWGSIAAGTVIENAVTGDGNDILIGSSGANNLFGMRGDDTYYVYNAADRVFEAIGNGFDRVLASVSYVMTVWQEIEILAAADAASTAAINLTGNWWAQTIFGNAGNNVLDTGNGVADVLVGLGGDDIYFVHNASDWVAENAGQGFDRVLTSVSYRLAAGQSIEILAAANTGGIDPINLTGNELGQTIYGNAGVNDLVGLGGDDIYYVYNAADRVFETIGGGFDRVLASVSYVILTAGPVDSNVSCPDVVRLNHCPEGRRIRYDDSYHTNRP